MEWKWMFVVIFLVLMTGAAEWGKSKVGVEGAIEALLNSGDHHIFATKLNQTISAGMLFPSEATILAPSDHSLVSLASCADIDVRSYIIPSRLDDYDLLQLPVGAQLSTIIKGAQVFVTSNNGSSISLNGVPVSRPHLFSDLSITVQKVSSVLHLIPSKYFEEDDGPILISPLFLPFLNRSLLYECLGVAPGWSFNHSSFPSKASKASKLPPACKSSVPASFLDIIKWIGFGSSLVLYLLPAIAIIKRTYGGSSFQAALNEQNGINLCTVVTSCAFSFIYEWIFQHKGWPLIIMNGVGVVLQLLFLIVYLMFSIRTNAREKFIVWIFLLVTSITLSITAAITLLHKTRILAQTGYFVAAFIMYSYPAWSTYKACSGKEFDKVPVYYFPALSLVRAFMWLISGTSICDKVEQLASGIGVVIAGFQLIAIMKNQICPPPRRNVVPSPKNPFLSDSGSLQTVELRVCAQ